MFQVTWYGVVVAVPIVVQVFAPATEYSKRAVATPETSSSESERTVLDTPIVPPLGGVVTLPVGGVASRLIVTDRELKFPALSKAEQVRIWPVVVVLVVMVDGSHPEVVAMPEPGSVGAGQVTETLLVYQPLFPSVPVTVGTPITGGVLSERTVIAGDVKVCPTLSVVITRRS